MSRDHTTRFTLSPLIAATAVFAACSTAAGRPAFTQGPNGHTFATITHAGNRPVLSSERVYNFNYIYPEFNFSTFGQVNHEYAMSVTEVKTTQWFGFVNSYWRYWEADGNPRLSSTFTSQYIRPANFTGPNPNFSMAPGSQDLPIVTSFRLAARYANWLHNGAPLTGTGLGGAPERWVFDTGAYDASTFVTHPVHGGIMDQWTRSEGARFWIPSLNEWTKAVYFDPNRYGEGQEGYWPYPGGQITAPTYGLPGEPGAQSNAGTRVVLPVGSYPDFAGPWGLLDASGGVREWTETVERQWIIEGQQVSNGGRVVRGSEAWNFDLEIIDDFHFGSSLAGIRIAMVVPSPGTTGMILIFGARAARRSRRSMK